MGQAGQGTFERVRARQSTTVIAALSELAAEVQRGRTVTAVLETAGRGTLRLGMRLYAFQVTGDDLVLRYIATARSRLDAIQERIGRSVVGLRARAEDVPLVRDVVDGRRILHRNDLDVFHSFLRNATGFDPSTLEGSPDTAGISNGVLAPIFVRESPWGLLGVTSMALAREDVDAVALFATHVGSAIEVAESIEALERTNHELASCNAELARAQRELVERERLSALGELAAVVAHEARDPLCVLSNAVRGLGEFVRAGSPKAKAADAATFASLADEELLHLTRIVSDLLDFAHPHPPTLRVGSIAPVVDAVAAVTTADGRLRFDVAGDLPMVELDAVFLRQALLSLVLSGLTEIGKDGTVTVCVRSEGAAPGREGERPCVRIDVVDDGAGIPADVRGSVYAPFFSPRVGTGLGLAVVKRIVDAHAGTLAVESSRRGTRFTIRLPSAGAAG